MKKISKQRGSALIIAVVVVILIAGLSGAFLTLTVRNSDLHFKQNQGDDAQQICDAGIEMARAALLKWRNKDIDTLPPGPALDPACYAWNKVFLHCQNVDGPGPTFTGMGTTANPDLIKADAVARFKSQVWAITADNTYNYDTTNTPASIGDAGLPNSATIGTGISDLFGVNRRYGKGAFHMVMKNNTGDIHGDGIDNGYPPSGNPWKWDDAHSETAQDGTTTVVYAGDPIGGIWNSKSFDPLIDGDGQAILVVTATLPDGTLRQVELMIGYPFTQGGTPDAIRTAGDLKMSGAFKVQGTLGSVFANGDITGNGGANASVSGDVSAAGDASGLTMQNQPGGGISSGVAPQNIQPIQISSFLTDDNYSRLRENMYVFNADGTWGKMSGTTLQTQSGTPQGFKFQGGKWVQFGSTAPLEAAYYINGDFSMQGNAPDMKFTIIATGSVELGGNAKFEAAHYNDPNTGLPSTDPKDSTGQLVIAGADIKLTGNGVTGDFQYKGSMWANEQVMIQGTFDLNGSITGANAADSAGSAVSSSNQLSDPDLTVGGTPTITYDGAGSLIKNNADHIDIKAINRLR
jgi:hypothetical protein